MNQVTVKEMIPTNLMVIMVFILDGNTKIGANVRRNFLLICLRHLIRTRAVKYQKRLTFLHACEIFSELPSNVSTMVYVEHNEQDRYRFTKKGNYNANFQLSLTENERFHATK